MMAAKEYADAEVLAALESLCVPPLKVCPPGTPDELRDWIAKAWGLPPRVVATDIPVTDTPDATNPVRDAVDTVVGHLINGRVVDKDVKRLDKAVDQAKRGATGPMKGVVGG